MDLIAGEKEKALQRLKTILREKSDPFFSDEELQELLEAAGNNLNEAAYRGFLLKAKDESITLPSGITVPNNQQYWLRLAKIYRKNRGGCLRRG